MVEILALGMTGGAGSGRLRGGDAEMLGELFAPA
jgi:hypothetical protein